MEMQWKPVLKAPTHCSHLDQTLPPQSHLLLLSTHLSIVWAAYDRCQYTGEELSVVKFMKKPSTVWAERPHGS